MPDVSRRRLFGLLAGAATIPVLPAMTKVSGFETFTGAPQVMFCDEGFFEELVAVTPSTSRAGMMTALCKVNPLMKWALKENSK